MKKILLFVLLSLAFICSAFATEFKIYDCQITQNSSGSFGYTLYLLPAENEFYYSGEIGLTFRDRDLAAQWFSAGDSFLSNDYKMLMIVPLSYTTSEEILTGESSNDTPALINLTTDEDKAKGYGIYMLHGFHQKDFISALLRDGFVFFCLASLDADKPNVEQYYYWNISDNEKREEALELFNRYIDYFY